MASSVVESLGGGTVDVLTSESVAFASSNGVIMAAPKSASAAGDGAPPLLRHAPFALTPFRVSRDIFETARSLAAPFGELVDKVSRDGEWLKETLAATAASDEFTGRLVKLHDEAAAHGGPRQAMTLGLHRSDYMLDDPAQSGADKPALLQVEMNTISAAFAGLSSRVAKLHSTVLSRHAEEDESLSGFLGVPASDLEEGKALPKNEGLQGMAAAIAAAHGHSGVEGGVVAFVVQEGEANAVDQRLLQFELWNTHRVRVLRISLAQVQAYGQLDSETNVLRVPKRIDADSGVETDAPLVPISVAYLRAGYTPTDYPSEQQWAGRLKLEVSMAVKCPSVAYQLVGTKKVQQALALPGVVERFVDTETAAAVRKSFAGLWSLDRSDAGEEQDRVLADARAHPERYVLKPQREGGGNNFYGADIVAQLDRLSAEEREAYILMQRIFPEVQRAYLVSGGKAVQAEALSEIGVYSSFIGDGATVVRNQAEGHLLRTKATGVDEGGVASGYAVLNSPILV